MSKYIDADEFVKKNREWYCEQCQKRKGMKRGKLQFVYEIGGAPCRACDVDDVISDIEDFPAADVEPKREIVPWKVAGAFDDFHQCTKCGNKWPIFSTVEWAYCPVCGCRKFPEPLKEEDNAEVH